ncbi:MULTISPECIES: helix-turn-helix transcriptional regulator [Niastella]|uniref:Helix-turn-helix transcriptional regulator n=1 Tax=Niastella soli TaxID=2821487 RepID=A0ABS3YXQ2_9BACT|nr:helix-turn-helix transcriptional regulator [Niastella soli]MBO9202195.1 helix-turn-helix transcriptional regulator [Niastella soli]
MGKVVFENERSSFLRIAYPQQALAGCIAYYFEIDTTLASGPLHITGLPSVNTLIAIDLLNEQPIRLMGHLTQCVTGSYKPGSKAFYAKLKPGVFNTLCPVPPNAIQNDQVAIPHLFRDFSAWQLADLPSFRHRVNLFETRLLRYQPFMTGYKQQYVELFTHVFSNAQYCQPESIQSLCNRHHITYASLRRYFLEHTGVSPKYCQKVIRFKSALQAYRTFGYHFNYTDFGYTDYAHFCKDAKGLTGKAPLEL